MLRQAVRTVLADAGGRQPSHEAWGLLLMAAGVDATKAAGLPARLGYVFHLGRWTESDVVAQLEAWGDALRVRAEPDVAAVVDRAAASLREQVAADPEPVGPAAAQRPAPAPAPIPPPPAAAPAASLPPPAQQARPQPPRPAQGPPPPPPRPQGPPQQGPPQQVPPQQGAQRQTSPWTVPPPAQRPVPPPGARQAPPSGGSYVPTAGRGGGRRPVPPRPGGSGATPRGTKPRSNRLAPIIGVVLLVGVCGCSLFGFVADLLSGSG